MALDPSDERQHAHAFLDRLPNEQLSAVRGLLETMLSTKDRKLALAPADDEPVTPDEAAAMEAAIASLEENGGFSMEEVLSEFGVTMDDLRKLPEHPLSQDAA